MKLISLLVRGMYLINLHFVSGVCLTLDIFTNWFEENEHNLVWKQLKVEVYAKIYPVKSTSSPWIMALGLWLKSSSISYKLDWRDIFSIVLFRASSNDWHPCQSNSFSSKELGVMSAIKCSTASIKFSLFHSSHQLFPFSLPLV